MFLNIFYVLLCNRFCFTIIFHKDNYIFNFLIYHTGHKNRIFYVNLESYCLCLIQRTLGELPDFEVMIWQLCHLQRFALICFSSNSFLPTKIINLIVFSIMS